MFILTIPLDVNAIATVSVGEEVSVGQQLVQYDSTSAQVAYDTASRAYNKTVRDTVIISNSMGRLQGFSTNK